MLPLIRRENGMGVNRVLPKVKVNATPEVNKASLFTNHKVKNIFGCICTSPCARNSPCRFPVASRVDGNEVEPPEVRVRELG